MTNPTRIPHDGSAENWLAKLVRQSFCKHLKMVRIGRLKYQCVRCDYIEQAYIRG